MYKRQWLLYKRQWLLVSLGALLFLGIAIVWFLCLWPLGTPKPFDRRNFDQVVAAIRSGSLLPNARGVVVLPEPWAHLTATGKVYVTHGHKSALVVFFPSWVGRSTRLINPLDITGDHWLEGYVYDGGANTSEVLAPPAVPPWSAVNDTRSELRLLPHRTTLAGRWFQADVLS
jgi:hypothetical protein